MGEMGKDSSFGREKEINTEQVGQRVIAEHDLTGETGTMVFLGWNTMDKDGGW